MPTSLYEIDTRAWLIDLGRRAGGPALTLDRVPDAELDRLAALGFEWVWLMGVWRLGRVGREVALADAGMMGALRAILPDLTPADVAGSVFAVAGFEVAESLGGGAALARLRERLRARGMRLMLDFVPNHTARDHPWVSEHPEYYVPGTDDDLAREPQNFGRAGGRVLAFGRDPYFPGWPDTFQLNYRHPALRDRMAGELARVARLCDGVRCDMAMLLLPEVFRSTWGDRAQPIDGTPADDTPWWPGAIARARAENPGFFLLAEVYWDLEHVLLAQGFDAVYDKRLYDNLRRRDPLAARAHLRAWGDDQSRCARFLENHDEDRAAAVFPPDVHRAAAVIAYLTPAVRFFHQGQLDGRTVRPSVHLSRRPDDPADPALSAFYSDLLALLQRPEARRGAWRLLECREAWAGNPTWEQFLAYAWEGPDEGGRLLVAVNFGPTRGQCFVSLPPGLAPPGTVRLRDRLGPSEYVRDGGDLAARGLYLDLPAWGYHAFAVEPG